MSGKWSPEQHARYAATIGVRRAAPPSGKCGGAFADVALLEPAPSNGNGHASPDLDALTEHVQAMRWTLLRVEDRLALLVSAAGIIPVPEPVSLTKDPDLVDAFRTLHLRLLRLERAGVTSGDWEEWIDEILQTVRQMDRKMTRIAPAVPRKKRSPGMGEVVGS